MKGAPSDWKGPFLKGHLPAWPCPACGRGGLVLVEETYSQTQTPASVAAWDLHGEPEMIVYEFNATMRCSHGGCRQEARVIGRTSCREDETYVGKSSMDSRWDDYLHPVAVYPAPPVIGLPHDCPDAVREQIERAFLVLWQDPSAAGNRLRVAIEALMDDLRVPKTHQAKGNRTRSSLHQRLMAYRGTDKSALSWSMAERLLAVKWLGNAGSHLSELTVDELLTAFDLLEAVLPRVCGDRDRQLGRIARAINKRRGPVRPRRRKRP